MTASLKLALVEGICPSPAQLLLLLLSTQLSALPTLPSSSPSTPHTGTHQDTRLDCRAVGPCACPPISATSRAFKGKHNYRHRHPQSLLPVLPPLRLSKRQASFHLSLFPLPSASHATHKRSLLFQNKHILPFMVLAPV